MKASQAGYTVLEATVALAIGAIVVTALTGLVGRSVQVRSILTTRTTTLANVRTSALLLAGDLEHARPGSLRIERARPNATPVISLERIAPEPVLVRYAVIEGTLTREVRHCFERRASVRTAPLLVAVRHLDARARAGGRWHATWTEEQVPRAVALTLGAADLDELTLTITPHVREDT